MKLQVCTAVTDVFHGLASFSSNTFIDIQKSLRMVWLPTFVNDVIDIYIWENISGKTQAIRTDGQYFMCIRLKEDYKTDIHGNKSQTIAETRSKTYLVHVSIDWNVDFPIQYGSSPRWRICHRMPPVLLFSIPNNYLGH